MFTAEVFCEAMKLQTLLKSLPDVAGRCNRYDEENHTSIR